MIRVLNKETFFPYLILILVTIISIYRFFYMISTSFMTVGEATNQYLIPKKLMFENYFQVWTSSNFQKYTLNSLIISSIVVIGILFTSIPAAYAFARIDFPLKNIIFYFLLISLMIPEIIMLLPHLLIIRGEIIPLPFGPSWMNTLKGLTVPFMGNVFVIFLLRQYFKKIPKELWDAARIDGANHLYFLYKVVVPISLPIIFFLLLTGFINTFQAFNHIYVMQTSSAGDTMDVVTVEIFDHFWGRVKYGYAAAEGVILFILLNVLAISQYIFFRKRLNYD